MALAINIITVAKIPYIKDAAEPRDMSESIFGARLMSAEIPFLKNFLLSIITGSVSAIWSTESTLASAGSGSESICPIETYISARVMIIEAMSVRRLFL